jgi:hypothetical protein
MKSAPKRPVAVEDLLRLKRAERPAAEFWVQFDRELRAKQLAALVGKRPWWQRLSVRPLFVGFARWSLPLGAGAALAVSFFALRESGPRTTVQASAPVAAAPAALQPSPAIAAPLVAPAAVESPVAIAVVSVAAPVAALETPAPAPAVAATEAVADLAAIVPLLGGAPEAPAAVSPSARLIAENLAANADFVEPALKGTLLGGARAFETRPASTRAAVDPLQQMASPAERARARLLTAMVSMASADDSSRTAERMARRIDEERLYDQVSRIGARGDRVNWKF